MPKALDLTNQKFGCLTAISKAESKSGKTYWNCVCDCGNTTVVQTGNLRDGRTQSCGHLGNGPTVKKKNCVHCGTPLKTTSKKYCSRECQTAFLYEEYIARWKQGLESGMKGTMGISKRIRQYLMKKYDNKCAQCGWGEINPFTKNIPLEVHHIDGIYTNNQEDNLLLLCPNCHSLTESFKGANVGNGRSERYNGSVA